MLSALTLSMVAALFAEPQASAAPATATSSPAATAIAAGTYSYRSLMNGQSLGSTTIVVKHASDATEIDEQAGGTVNGVQATATATLVLGADFTPKSYQGQYAGGGQSAKSTATFSGNNATLMPPGGTAKNFQLFGDAKHFVVIDGLLLAGFVALPAEMRAWNGATAIAVLPLYGQSLPLAPDTNAPARPATVPATDSVVSVSGAVPFALWYDPASLIVDELDVPSQSIVVTRVKS